MSRCRFNSMLSEKNLETLRINPIYIRNIFGGTVILHTKKKQMFSMMISLTCFNHFQAILAHKNDIPFIPIASRIKKTMPNSLSLAHH